LNTSLTILQITNRIPYPLNDGGNIATYNVTKYLNRFGHRVILASLNTKKHDQDPSVLSSIAKVYTTNIDTTLRPLGLIKGLFTKIPYNIKRFISPEFKILLEKIITENNPQIIHLEGIYLSIYADTIKKISSSPLVLRSHNVEYEIWERNARNEKNLLKKWYLKNLSHKIQKFEQLNLHKFEGILSITERDGEFYKRNNFAGKLKTIPAGVDLELYSAENISNEKISLCFLGSMEWMPNVQGIEWFLQEVWPTLRNKSSELTLHIAGKNMSEEMKNRKVDGVFFYGMVPDAAAFLKQHPIMIVPLLSGGGMRLKIVEAMVLGRCVLSTPIGAEGIEAKENSEIILASNPKEFIDKIEMVINGKINTKIIGENAQKLAREKYSWEKLVKEIEKFYFELI
jgi:glycosyltransferase involved in cell wall biosynthesis